MKVLFTGASSFTGTWFVRQLAEAGHEVTATFRQPLSSYEGIRAERGRRLRSICQPAEGVGFGDRAFLDLIESQSWDLLCHHGADVTNYKSPDFDVQQALKNNTLNLPLVLRALSSRGCSKLLLTGSVFEAGEGAGSEGLPAFSPYGVSKGITASVFEYYARAHGFRLAKFVIPNPFGPFEEPRFTAYLVKKWFAGEVAAVNTPAYVRDNIHVSLLAKAYVATASTLPNTPGFQRLNPSGYAGSQGGFALQFASELRQRLGLECQLHLATQTDFSEPRVRINTDVLDPAALAWDERAAWDETAEYCREAYGPGR